MALTYFERTPKEFSAVSRWLERSAYHRKLKAMMIGWPVGEKAHRTSVAACYQMMEIVANTLSESTPTGVWVR